MNKAVIFDMDGLLIDSEPLWKEAANEFFAKFNIILSEELYSTTTGLRTKEFVEYWLNHFNLDKGILDDAEYEIISIVTEKIRSKSAILPGAIEIINFFHDKNYSLGIASSSPMPLIDMVIEKLGIRDFVQARSSGQDLAYGKPHPEVYLICASQLKAAPANCICFEDSLNGMISAKAAKMKCVVVPSQAAYNDPRWSLADLKISSLKEFNEEYLKSLV